MSTAFRAKPSQWLIWFCLLAAAAGVLLVFRSWLDKAHVALVFLLVVLGGSAAAGRLLGLALAGTAFLLFDVLFLPPYNTLRIGDPLDWIVLLAFLVTSVVAAQLLERQRWEAEVARARAAEIDRLATLGAETLNAPRAEDALRAITDVIRQLMGTDHCDVLLSGQTPGETVAVTVAAGAPDGAATFMTLPARTLDIPLTVRGAAVGTLRVSADQPFLLSRDQQRVMGALSYYAALGVERLRVESVLEETDTLRRADRLKDALLASVSHDLRTPLTAIKGIANEISRGGDPGQALDIEEEVDRMNMLVTDLLDLSQLAAGEMPVHLALNTADDVIGAALQRVESVFTDRAITTVLANDWPELVGRFDFVHTMRVLTNLLENAAKYAPVGTPITLRSWREGDTLCFAVEDCGAGVDSVDRERIFQPFVRGGRAASGIRGTGLGLSIARRLAEVQGGRLEYAPTSAARSRFVLRVAAADVRLT